MAYWSLWVSLVLAISPCVTRAQQLAPAHRDSTRSDRAASPSPQPQYLAFRDGERLIPASLPKDFSRYPTPAACLSAASRAYATATRAEYFDTLETDPGDRLPDSVIDVARRCGARFSAASTAAADLTDLFELSLWMQDTGRADSVLARHLRLASTPEQRGLVLLDAVQAALRVRPARVVMASRILAQLDSQGAAVRIPAFLGHRAILAYATRIFDPILMDRQLDAVRMVAGQMTSAERMEWREALSEGVLLRLILDRLSAPPDRGSVDDNLDRFVDRAKEELSGMFGPNGAAQVSPLVNWIKGNPALRKLFDTAAVAPLSAQFWYPTDGATRFPQRGKVTLVAEGRHFCTVRGHVMCGPWFGMLRRLYEKYHDAGFEIVFLDRTDGYFRDTAPLSPEVEASAVARWLLEEERLPVVLGIEETPYHWLPDGRRTNEPTPFMATYAGTDGFLLRRYFLVDRAGRIVFGFVNAEQPMLEAFIKKALSVPPGEQSAAP